MKLLITIIFLIQFSSHLEDFFSHQKSDPLSQQEYFLCKEWIGPEGEYLYISKDSARFETYYTSGMICFHQDKNILTLITASLINKNNFRNDSFKIDKLNNDTLILAPLNENAFNIVKRKEPVVYVNRTSLYNPQSTFQKIIYSVEGGIAIGQYHKIQMEIDSSGYMLLSCMPGKGMLKGTYKGQLLQAKTDRLKKLINESVPERFALSPQYLIDRPIYNFRFYQNNTVKAVSCSAVPYFARDLVIFLESLIYNEQLQKISDQFQVIK